MNIEADLREYVSLLEQTRKIDKRKKQLADRIRPVVENAGGTILVESVEAQIISVKGTVSWEDYAKDLGGDDEGAEVWRKAEGSKLLIKPRLV